ncbi:hypothetical protein VIGAN_01272900 [Vigna angularis var. angularis]|uniref:Uncharacterized protein n=1 Tax=Vigna angularis var. angularis TaxID=157739 RepID=A0A0S3R376_PHAAN|nr:hypothetical protein VIGAN_01272900 [Vigna angularis var. angularis]
MRIFLNFLMGEAKEKIKLHLARALVEMNNTRMIDEKNPELTNEGLSPALGSGSINFPSSRKILVETVSKMSELL